MASAEWSFENEYGDRYLIELEGEQICWITQCNDGGRILTHSQNQPASTLRVRGPALDPMPFFESMVPASILEEMLTLIPGERPAWMDRPAVEARQLFRLARSPGNRAQEMAAHMEWVDEVDGFGNNALHYALYNGDEENALALLAAGCLARPESAQMARKRHFGRVYSRLRP